MLKKIGFLVAFLMVFSCTAFASDWIWITSNDKEGYFFDAQSIQYDRYLDGRINKNAVIVWVKTVYSQEGANKMADSFGDDRYYNLKHSTGKWVLYIYSKKIAHRNVTYYDKEGSVIDSDDYSNFPPQDILPDSVGETIYRSICEFCRVNDSYVAGNTR